MRPCTGVKPPSTFPFEANMDKKSSDKSEKKLVSFRLPEDLLEALRDRADQDNTTVTELVCRLMRQGLQTSTDDRISALEDEMRELRQLKQVNFGNLSPMPFYASLVPPQPVVTPEPDPETKLRIVRLEAQMQEGIAKLEAMMEEVLATRESRRQSPQRVDEPPTDHRPS